MNFLLWVALGFAVVYTLKPYDKPKRVTTNPKKRRRK